MRGLLSSSTYSLALGLVILLFPMLLITVFRKARGNFKYRRLIMPLVASFLLTSTWLLLQILPLQYAEIVRRDYVLTMTLVALTFLAVRFLRIAVFDFVLGGRRGQEVPSLLKDLLSIFAYFVLFAAILKATLNVEITTLLATSAVITVVIGLALQETLGNLFAGLSLHLERTFRVGDVIRVGDLEGQVEGMTWRSVKLVTSIDTHIVLPNSHVAKERLQVFARAQEAKGGKLYVHAAYSVTPSAVEEAIRFALRSVAGVSSWREPQVLLNNFADSSMEYEIRFWTADYFGHNALESSIRKMVWYEFRRRGIGIPFPIRSVFLHRGAEEKWRGRLSRPEVVTLLRRIPIFRPLSEEELQFLAERVEPGIFAPGETVIREEEPGDSFFIITFGKVEVLKSQKSGRMSRVAMLGESDYFGEMALLTGEPRAATVQAVTETEVLEVRKPAIQQLLENDARLVDRFSDILTERRQKTEEAVELDSSTTKIARPGLGASLRVIGLIKSYFKLE